MDFSTEPEPACLLVDNGSLRPAATLALRRLAAALAERIDRPVAPVSLLHSNKVPVVDLEGTPAEVFDDALRQRAATGVRRLLAIPLFFGPSGAVVDYMPGRVKLLTREMGSMEVKIAASVAGADPSSPDQRLVEILAERVRETIRAKNLHRPVVVMVDHGSPQRAVCELRDALGRQLNAALAKDATAVVAASMERRTGAAYDFAEPLLERALTSPPAGDGAGDVVIAPLFFAPGRHAGPGGDIETIARNAEARTRDLRTHLAPLVGNHPLLVEILADRYRDARRSG